MGLCSLKGKTECIKRHSLKHALIHWHRRLRAVCSLLHVWIPSLVYSRTVLCVSCLKTYNAFYRHDKYQSWEMCYDIWQWRMSKNTRLRTYVVLTVSTDIFKTRSHSTDSFWANFVSPWIVSEEGNIWQWLLFLVRRDHHTCFGNPTRARARFLDHTEWCTPVTRISLYVGSARHRNV